MRILLHLVCLSLACFASTTQSMEAESSCLAKPGSQQKLLFVETGNNPAYAFNNFLSSVQSLGFAPTFKQGYEVDNSTLDSYNTVVINVDRSLFKALLAARKSTPTTAHPYIANMQNTLAKLATLKHKNIVYVLPGSAITHREPDAEAVVQELLAQSDSTIPKASAGLLKDCITLFKEPDVLKKYQYATTLRIAKPKALSEGYEETQAKFKALQQPADVATLPAESSTDSNAEALAPLWPYGFSWRNQHTDNKILMTRDSYLTFADIGENFWVNPLDTSLRHKLHSIIYRMLQQFLVSPNVPRAKFPRELSSKTEKAAMLALRAQRAHRQYASTHAWFKDKPVSCAWMDVRSYFGKEPEALDYVLNAGLDILWLDLIPEMFLATNGRNGANKQLFLDQVAFFTKNLQVRAKALNKPLPRLFMGTDITLNYGTGPNQPITTAEMPVVTLYGKTLSKVPSPLDVKGFWQTQTIDVINAFVDEWQSRIGNGLPLDGIFFDFEMYQAQDQASNYDALMDFSDLAWQTFLAAHPQKDLPVLATTEERVQYLTDTQQMNQYFETLSAQAKQIGILIHDNIKKRLPNAVIGAYNAIIPSSWWYLGLFAGLSKPQEPLIFATFNNNYFSHAKWLENHGVYVHHLQAMMLSKLRKQEDFKQIDNILNHHDGIWFNRFSQLAHEKPSGKEHADCNESSPLPAAQVAEGIHERLNVQDKK